MRERIAYVKTGWSEEYAGGKVSGQHGYLNNREGHEKYNFLREPDNTYYGYIPPIGKYRRPPQPKVKEDWLIIFLAKKEKVTGLHIVGWYKAATFEPDYKSRPEHNSESNFPTDKGDKFKYCLSAHKAHLILPTSGRIKIDHGGKLGSTPIAYVRGNGHKEPWREELAKKAEQIIASKDPYNPHDASGLLFPDQEFRKKVEKAAIDEATHYLESENYKISDRQKDNCGYDLLATRKKNLSDELHVEVKGTKSKKNAILHIR